MGKDRTPIDIPWLWVIGLWGAALAALALAAFLVSLG